VEILLPVERRMEAEVPLDTTSRVLVPGASLLTYWSDNGQIGQRPKKLTYEFAEEPVFV
jgi:hypothetical protein